MLKLDKERLLIEYGDTFVVIPYKRATTLFSQIAKLSEHKITADSLIADKNSTITSCRGKVGSLKGELEIQQQRLDGKDVAIADLRDINKILKKKWIKTVIYSSGGSVVIGLIAGILIVK